MVWRVWCQFCLGVGGVEVVEELYGLGEGSLYEVDTVGSCGQGLPFEGVVVELVYHPVHSQHLLLGCACLPVSLHVFSEVFACAPDAELLPLV